MGLQLHMSNPPEMRFKMENILVGNSLYWFIIPRVGRNNMCTAILKIRDAIEFNVKTVLNGSNLSTVKSHHFSRRRVNG